MPTKTMSDLAVPSIDPVVLLFSTSAVAVMALRFGVSLALPAFAVFSVVLVIVSRVDLRERRIPNVVVLPAAAVALPLLLLAGLGDEPDGSFVRALMGGVGCFAVLLLSNMGLRGSVGMGDVKLGLLVGLHLAWLGWLVLLLGFLLTFVAQVVVGLWFILRGRAHLNKALPLAPFLALGTLAAIFYSSS